MKIRNAKQLNDFIGAVDKCKGGVWLESPEGEQFDLKSRISQYVGIGKLLSERGDLLELFCSSSSDEPIMMHYFSAHPEVLA